jgi:hypothetical protein
MPTPLTAKQLAFDAAIKAQSNFEYRGIADLETLREKDPTFGPAIDQLVEIRESLNAALALEGQNIVGDAPHKPFYFDYVDSSRSQGLAFKDADHSFIGITISLVFDVRDVARLVSQSDNVVTGIGLSLDTSRDILQGLLLWMLLGFITAHEYAHHTHGHWMPIADGRKVYGELRRQAREADADGWAAYLTMADWVLAGGRQTLLELLKIELLPTTVQNDMAVACFVVAQAAFSFLREPEPVDKDRVYWATHPPQPVRLQLMSRFVLKFSSEFAPNVRETLTQPRYQSLMDAVSLVMWIKGRHAVIWQQHHAFLRTPEGVSYRDALLSELDAFRAVLRQWEANARGPSAPTAANGRRSSDTKADTTFVWIAI